MDRDWLTIYEIHIDISQNIDIDLDNLARRIVPQINKRLQPAGKYFWYDYEEQGYTPKTFTEHHVIRIPR